MTLLTARLGSFLLVDNIPFMGLSYEVGVRMGFDKEDFMLAAKRLWFLMIGALVSAVATAVEVPGRGDGVCACLIEGVRRVARHCSLSRTGPTWPSTMSAAMARPNGTRAVTHVLRSGDRGAGWEPIARIEGMFWATLFAHESDLYLIGTDRHDGAVIISRSRDGGRTWTEPNDARVGPAVGRRQVSLRPGPRLGPWRSILAGDGRRHGRPAGGATFPRLHDVGAGGQRLAQCRGVDVEQQRVEGNPQWLDGRFDGWLEGNAVATPDGDIVNVLRVEYAPEGGKAAIVRVSADGQRATFDPIPTSSTSPAGPRSSPFATIRFPIGTGRWPTRFCRNTRAPIPGGCGTPWR